MRTQKTLLNILTKITELILQHRIDTKRSFFQHTKSIMTRIHQARACRAMEGLNFTNYILQDIVLNQYYGIRNNLISQFKSIQASNSMRLNFKCLQKATSNLVKTESWIINFSHLKDSLNQDKQSGVIELIEEVIKGLRCQPIFSQIITDKEIKKKFIIDYEINLKDQDKATNLFDFDHSWCRQAWLNGYKISLQVFFKSMKNSAVKSDLLINISNKKELESSEDNRKTFDSSTSARKISFYQYYDESLDVTVISSDSDQTKRYSSNFKQVQMEFQEDTQDEFQLLIEEENISDDFKFLNLNEAFFRKMASLELSYFN